MLATITGGASTLRAGDRSSQDEEHQPARPEIVMSQPSTPHHIPHYEGPVPCDDEDPPTHHRLVLGTLAALTVFASGAALLVARPWDATGTRPPSTSQVCTAVSATPASAADSCP